MEIKKVTKAVIPAAGLGTRVFPAAKAVPKGMLPIVDKPAIQYIAEEAVASGIKEILIIVNSFDTVTEKHFSKTDISADISYAVQKEQKGLGHAVSKAESFIGGDAFAVMYADDVIIGDDPCVGQLCRVYEKHGKSVAGIKQVSQDLIHKYSSLKVGNISDNVYDVTDMIEKPAKGKEFSLFSILGRCVLTPDIFEILKKTPPGAGGEIQLTDAMNQFAVSGNMMGVDFTGTRYDIGDKLGILKANIELGLLHEETGARLKEYLKDLKI